MLLVISIILTLSVLSFPFMNTKTIYITDECVKKQIEMIINQAKSKAIISHEKVSLIVSKQEISFIDHQKKYRVVLPNNYFFNNIKEIYFNKDGNINQANHIDLIAPKKKYTLILLLMLSLNIFSLCHLTILNSQGFQSMKQTNDIRLLKNILIANYKYENQNSILLSNYLELENYTISYTVDDMGDYFLIETRLKNDRYKLNITFYLELDKEKNVIKKVE